MVNKWIFTVVYYRLFSTMPRARKSAEDKAETDVVSDICSSVMAAQTLSPASFWQLLAEYPHREAASIYWYRLEPVIDRTKTGKSATNIGIWPLDDIAADETRLVNEHGSGKYRARLSDANRPGRNKEVANSVITIRDAERPPVVDLREIVPEARENRSYIQGLRASRVPLPWEQEEKDMPQSVEGAAVQEMGALTRDLLEEVKQRHQAPQKDPFELMLDAKKVFDSAQPDNTGLVLKVAEMMTKANSSSGKTTELMFGLLTTLLTAQMKQTPATKSDLEQLKDLLGIANELRDSGSGGGGWSNVAAAIPAMFSGAAQVMGQVVALKQMAASGGVADVPHPAGAPVPAVVNRSTGDQQEMNIAKLMQLGERAIQAFRDGLSGEEFAAAVYILEPQLYEVLAGMGKSQIMGIMQSQPAVWAQLAPRQAEVETFIDEFLAYGQESPAEMGEPAAPPEQAA